MISSTCNESQSLLQGMTDLLDDIAFFSGTLAHTDQLIISQEEKKALRQARELAKTGAKTLETSISSHLTTPILDAEIGELEAMIHDISLTGYLVTHIAQRQNQGFRATNNFDSLYSALQMNRRVHELQNVFTDFDCQRKDQYDNCPAQHRCLFSSWLSRRSERNNMIPDDCPKGRILLVDDDPLIRKAFKRSLASESYALKTAASGREALALLKDESFDVIVADFLMPGQDGCELLAQVEQHWPEMARILFTASFDNRRVRNCLIDGTALDIIPKPWENDLIYAILNRALDATTKKMNLPLINVRNLF